MTVILTLGRVLLALVLIGAGAAKLADRAHLSGRTRMDVSLEVYEDDRGAWVKSEPIATLAPVFRKQISGCTEPGEWLDAYPADGWMSGLGLETVPSGPLRTGTYTTENLTLTVY